MNRCANDNTDDQTSGIDDNHHVEPLSDQVFVALEDTATATCSTTSRRAHPRWQSKSLDDLRLPQRRERSPTDENHVSNTTRTEMDLSGIGCDQNELNCVENDRDFGQQSPRSRSAPVSPTQIYDKEFAAFLQCEQQQQQIIADNFVYNMDLSDTIETAHYPHSRADFLFDEDFSSDDMNPSSTLGSIIHSNLINSCLTITEENEEELEQLRRDDDEEAEQQRRKRNQLLNMNDGSASTVLLHDDDDRADLLENDDQVDSSAKEQTILANANHSSLLHCEQDDNERLSTIYESPSSHPRTEEEDEEEEEEEEITDDPCDKLIVYDIATVQPIRKSFTFNSIVEPVSIPSSVSPLSSHRSPLIDRTRIRSCYTDATFDPCPSLTNTLSASRLCGTTQMITSKVFQNPSVAHSPHSSSPTNTNEKSSSSPVINIRSLSTNPSMASLPVRQQSPSRSSPMSLSVPMLLLPTTNERMYSSMDKNQLISSEPSSQHTKTMKVVQKSSSSSLSDFILPTSTSTLKNNTSHYEEVPSVHHSLTDCSLINQVSCCAPLVDGDSLCRNKSPEKSQRRSSFTRRILTNGLLLSHCSSSASQRRSQPPLTFNHQHQRHQIKPRSEEKLSTLSSPNSSSSSQSSSPSGDKLISRSDFMLQQQQNLSPQRKATSLKSIRVTSNDQPSKILYPIDFESQDDDQSWYQKCSSSIASSSSHQNKVPTSDSGIVIDTAGTRPTSKSSNDDNDGDAISGDTTNSAIVKQYEINYRRTLSELTIIKKSIVDIESRLNEAMRELEIERALVEGEHDLVFKQILDASENDQENIRHLYNDLQSLTDRIMAEKNSIRNEIDYTQEILYKLENELHELEEHYRPSDDKILKKREIIAETRKKHEDLEFQLMELETRCEAELEQAEAYFHNERSMVTQNAKMRQHTLRDLDHQQQVILNQVTMEKEKLEREKQKLKLLFKQKKFEANELEQKLHKLTSSREKNLHINGNGYGPPSTHDKDVWSNGYDLSIYHSTPSNLYSSLSYTDSISSPRTMKKDAHQEKLDEIQEMIAIAKLEKMTILEQQLRERYNELVQCHDEHVKRIELEEKLANEIQNRDYLVEYEVRLREKNRLQERPLTRYLPIRSVDFDLRAHIEGGGHALNSSHIHITPTSCRGFLHKMGGMKFKTWNRRWFVFDRKRRSLFYYQDKTETKLRGCIYFQSIVEVYVDHLQSISLRSPEPREATFIVKTIERPYYLVAPTVEAMRIWVDVLITGAEGNTFAGES